MDLSNIAELNTFLVLDAVRSGGSATRRQLSRDLGLSEASVSRIVRRLLASGLIEELPGAGTVRGRTPSVLRFAGSAGGVIAVDLGGTRCHGAFADLAGVIVAEDYRPAGEGSDAAGTLLTCIGSLESRAAERTLPVRAVVVGIPALIDPSSGLATAGPNVHWQGFDLIGMLRRGLSQPFEVDNDVNLAALGQAWRGAGRGIGSFVTLSLGTGVGGAVVIDGHLVRGRHNAAGEAGYFPVPRGRRPGRPRSRLGLEEVASGPAVRARAASLIRRGEPSSLALGSFGVADIFVAAARGDRVGGMVVSELITDVAATIAGITALIDPERVILDGSIGRALEPWLADLRASTAAQVFRVPDIVISQLGPNATVLGAVARALALVAELDDPAHLPRRVLRQHHGHPAAI